MKHRELRMERKKSNRRPPGPIWCLGLLLLAGCNSVPHAGMMHRARQGEFVRSQIPSTCPEVARAIQSGQPIPICFDTVFRLAQDQNGQVRLARMRLEDAETDQVWAS